MRDFILSFIDWYFESSFIFSVLLGMFIGLMILAVCGVR
jgi:hypothetical protein